ncbi:B-cell receptor CD22-like [Odontesthes bonariensis]
MLECHTSCDLPKVVSYVWFRDGEEVSRQISKYYTVDIHEEKTISCSVTGHENIRSPKLSVKVNRGVTDSSFEVCAVKGSTLKISCNYTYGPTTTSHQNRFCSTAMENDQRVDEKNTLRDRTEYHCDASVCTLSISNLRNNDSDEYEFKLTSNHENAEHISSVGVTLSVTDPHLQVNVRRLDSQFRDLVCQSSCQLPDRVSYSWYKNGQPVEEKQKVLRKIVDPADSYQCSVEGYEHRSTAVYAPRLPSVSASPTGGIVEGTSVSLNCSSDANPAANYSWIKMNGGQSSLLLSREPYLFFSSIKSTDSGDYHCTAESDLGRNTARTFIDVQYAPRLPSVSVNPTDVIVEGTSMSLNCSSDANPAANYSWIKKKEGQSSLLLSREPYLFFSSIKSTDSGDYHCTAESDLGRNTASKFIKVQYAPRLPTLSVNPTGVIVEGTSVRLTCSSDAEPPASYNWYKKKNSLLQASGRNFIITNTKPDHSGHYYCEARNRRGHHNSSIHLTIVAVSPQAGKIAIIGIASVIFPAIILSIFLLLRKKRPKGSIPESGERPDNSGQCQRIHQERQDNPPEDIHYASVRFLRNQTDPIYCNIRLAGARKPNEEDYESVEYATVNFTNMSSDPRTAGQSGEDPASLYSVVNKIQMNS